MSGLPLLSRAWRAGWSEDRTDCDDSSSNIYPGATERCDARDEDCDGEVDENASDALTWYADGDSDGFGDAGVAILGCDLPEGHVAQDGDCDDSDATVYPDAPETDCADTTDRDCDGVPASGDGDGDGWSGCEDCNPDDPYVSPGGTERCDGADNDCNGEIDEEGAVDAATWYTDADGDGYGDPAATALACGPGVGYVDNAEDCDDLSEFTHPGAVEVCGNDSDEDCDDLAASCGPWGEGSLYDADTRLVGMFSEGATYNAIADAGDVDGDGNTDLLVGAMYSSRGAENGGGAFLVTEIPSGAEGFSTASAAILVGESRNDWAGRDVATAGDADGDGYADVWMTAHCYDTAYENAGASFLFYGPLTGTMGTSEADVAWFGWEEDVYVGFSVSGAGDVDGDGTIDGVIGSAVYDWWAGVAHMVFGVTDLTGTLDYADVRLDAESPGDHFGTQAASLTDTDGDGLDDVGLSAICNDEGALCAGAVYVITDPASGDYDVADVSYRLAGTGYGHGAGNGLAGAGDMNGDGYADVAVGAIQEDTYAYSNGAVYLVYGPVTAHGSLADADVTLLGTAYGAFTGPVDAGLDIDADGSPDMLIGAYGPGRGSDYPGTAYMVRGPVESGSFDLEDVADGVFYGRSADDNAGHSVALLADPNADGYADLAIGAPADDEASVDAGVAYIFYGEPW